MHVFKKIFTVILLSGLLIAGADAQKISIESVNEFMNPQHRDMLGTYAYGDTLFVKGTYNTETVTSIQLQLLTFRKSPWTRTDAYGFELPQPLSGIIDTFLVVPHGYTLKIPDGDTANSQMLQVRGSFSDGDEFSNLLLNVIEEHPVRMTLIDFDEVFGSTSGQSLVNDINSAVSIMLPGDTLLFRSAEYDFQGISLILTKGIFLSGEFPVTIDKGSPGAYDVKSTFRDMKNFHIRSDNVTLMNMRFMPIETIGYVFTRLSHGTPGMFYSDILVKNVIFENGNLQCYGESGAGVEFRNVSFLNFAHGGYNCNRKVPIDEAPRALIKRCKFVPNWDEVFYNTRGVSMDAGNDNHPVVWDMNGMLIDSCLFDGTGVGWSKCKNATVSNCHFIGYRGDVDMIHMEEYTNHIHVEGNLFEYSKPSRTFYQDRSLQPCHDITIVNNTFVGQYKWVFWGNSPQNLRFENNDMTGASASNPANLTFDFTNHQTAGWEEAPYEMPIENLVIRNNPGINKTDIGIMSIHVLEGDTTNIIEDYPESKIQKNMVTERPKSLIDTAVIYRIVNNASGESISARNESTQVKLNAESTLFSSELWEVKFLYPYNYTFRNLNTGNYMEVYKIYTLGDYDREELPAIYIEQKSTWEDKAIQPHFFLSEVDGRGSGLFQLYPGTNEKKSRLVKSRDDVILDLAQDKDAGRFVPADASSTWKLEEMLEMSLGDSSYLGVFQRTESDTVLTSENAIRYNIVESRVINDTTVTDTIVLDSVYSVYAIYGLEISDSVYIDYTISDTMASETVYYDTSVVVIDTITSYTPLDIEESVADASSIMIYPVPARERLNILVPPAFIDTKVQVMDMRGRLLLVSDIRSERIQLDISAVPSGFYILRFVNKEAGIRNIKPLVIH